MKKISTTFEDLIVWQKAHRFVLSAYRLSQSFPKSETYGLTSQFRRAAVSIAANIAEGYKKRSKADKFRYYNIAQGSIEECRYYLILIKDLKYGEVTKLTEYLEEVSRLLESYSRAMLNSGFWLLTTCYFAVKKTKSLCVPLRPLR